MANNSTTQNISIKKLPVVFVGHGSPMNAVAKNDYSECLFKFGTELPRPDAILVISAHWLTQGTYITSTDHPKLIYDMYGFPDELYHVKYPAKGSPNLAELILRELSDLNVKPDNGTWGLDHGTWSPLVHMFPQAEIPVLQLSIDMTKPPQFHFELGQKLSFLRKQNILILGSGNIVHNLRKISWDENAPIVDWAARFDQWTKSRLDSKNFSALISEFHNSEDGKLSIPSLDHYLPLLYVIGAASHDDQIHYIYEKIQNASIAMRSFIFEKN